MTLNGCRVDWGDKRPEYFTHVLEASNTSELKLTDFVGNEAHSDRSEDIVVY